MSLRTPNAIRTWQRKLYGKPAPARRGAKAEPGFRFYILYDKVWRTDILGHAYDLARANGGASGVDGAAFEQIETAELEDWLTRLNEELRTKTCRCQPVRRVMIPKPAAASGRSASRRFGTAWCKLPRNWYWNRYSKPTSTPPRMATGQIVARVRRSRRC
jgi:hypothetical protein